MTSSSATRAGPTPATPWSTAAQTYKLSLVPSGIFRPQVQCVVAAGVVINPESLLAEIDALEQAGHPGRAEPAGQRPGPRHLPLARRGGPPAERSSTGGEAIGTTLRGIGPCYCDKLGRSHAIRLGDMYRADFRSRIEQIVAVKRRVVGLCGGGPDAPCRAGPRRDLRAIQPPGRTAPPLRRRHHGLPAGRGRGRQAHPAGGGPRGACSTSITAPSPSSPAATARAWASRAGSGAAGVAISPR